ncbi:hypothetical protein J7T55_006094 [Diaporthe amygdali]|uniref:uncharacterized protein n=1 Tax=Phomopsis amygdali TaxID=1214568 RepID=UPI0022FE28BA|nr:uncharacterized protein J7T55_006094 [Diaporthe amygdali]KAJ0124753.1 hypothetical protein J7T55_006094 [Diaporthe amygdali]
MCVIIVDVALCDSTCSYAAADVPDGCLRIYPYTYSKSICEEAQRVLGCCGKVEMEKRENKNGSRIEKRICESCVAWSALMRDKDGRKARRSTRKSGPLRDDSDSEWQTSVLTPPDSTEPSDLEMDV